MWIIAADGIREQVPDDAEFGVALRVAERINGGVPRGNGVLCLEVIAPACGIVVWNTKQLAAAARLAAVSGEAEGLCLRLAKRAMTLPTDGGGDNRSSPPRGTAAPLPPHNNDDNDNDAGNDPSRRRRSSPTSSSAPLRDNDDDARRRQEEARRADEARADNAKCLLRRVEVLDNATLAPLGHVSMFLNQLPDPKEVVRQAVRCVGALPLGATAEVLFDLDGVTTPVAISTPAHVTEIAKDGGPIYVKVTTPPMRPPRPLPGQPVHQRWAEEAPSPAVERQRAASGEVIGKGQTITLCLDFNPPIFRFAGNNGDELLAKLERVILDHCISKPQMAALKRRPQFVEVRSPSDEEPVFEMSLPNLIFDETMQSYFIVQMLDAWEVAMKGVWRLVIGHAMTHVERNLMEEVKTQHNLMLTRGSTKPEEGCKKFTWHYYFFVIHQ